MAVDYPRLRVGNERRYSTKIGEYDPTLPANRYGIRAHFVYELRQNVATALAKRDRSYRRLAADANRRIIQIQDPAGKARTLSFDRGWLSAAQADSERESQADRLPWPELHPPTSQSSCNRARE